MWEAPYARHTLSNMSPLSVPVVCVMGGVQVTELAGLDNMEHGGPAYPEFNLVPYNNGSAER